MANESGEKGKMGCAIAVVAVLLPLLLAVIMLAINNKPPQVTIPTHSVPKDNGLDYFLRAADAISYQWPGATDSAKWTISEYENLVTDNAQAYAILHQGLTKECVCPPMRGENAFSNPYGADAMSELRNLAKALRGAAVYYEKKRDYGRAVEYQLDAVEMGLTYPHKASLIQDLVGIACAAIGYSKIEDNLAHLNSQELARAAARVERIRKKMTPFSEVIQEEGYVSASLWVEQFSSRKFRQSVFAPWLWPTLSPVALFSGGTACQDFVDGARMAFANKTAFINRLMDYSNAITAEAAKPFTGKSSVSKPLGPWMSDLFDVSVNCRPAHIRTEACVSLIQTDIALRRFNADQGNYPAKLDDLVPRYLKTIPIDPFGIGKPLRYKPLDGGKSFLVYSVGGNMTDDGGKPSPKKSDWKNGDVLLSSM